MEKIPQHIKEMALEGKQLVRVRHKDGSITLEARPKGKIAPNQIKRTPPPPVKTTNIKVGKPKKKFNKKKLIPIFLIPIVIGGIATPIYKYGNDKVQEYNQANAVFRQEKVNKDIEFYGGDSRYVDTNFHIFNLGNDKLYNHFDLNENRSVRIVYDNNITDRQKEQFQHTFDYINSVFKVLDPSIHFEVVEGSKSDADIYIQQKAIANNMDGSKVGMNIVTETDSINKSQLVGATINVNTSVEMNDSEMRFYMLHEMYHLLTGSSDVNERESETFSIYNYGDVAFLVSQIETAWESEEEKKEAMDGHMVTMRPVLSAEQKDSFVTFLPTDLGTLIALYGDSSIQSNKEAYIKLLTENHDLCKSIFGRQPFFVDGYELPKIEKQDTNTNVKDDNDLSY